MWKKNREIDEELSFHLEASIEKKIASGMDPEAARKEALRAFGGVDQTKEEIRDIWAIRCILGWWRDSRLGLRRLWSNKTFSATVILTLGLAIGCNVAIFSTLNELIIKPLPFHRPDQLVEIYNSYSRMGDDKAGNNLTNYLEYLKNNDIFESASLRQSFWTTAGLGERAMRTQMYKTTIDYFETLEVRPLLGSFFQEAHRYDGENRVVVLSNLFWEEYFASDSEVIGRSLEINGRPHIIIGVAPQSVSSMDTSVGFFIPWAWRDGEVDTAYHMARHMNYGQLWARLADGISLQEALGRVRNLNTAYLAQQTKEDQAMLLRGGHTIKAQTVKKERIRELQHSLFMLQLAAILILLISCLNISNLLFARVNERQLEFGIRSAIGARKLTLVRQSIAELSVLGTAACLLGMFVGSGGIHLLNTTMANLLPPVESLRMNGTVLMAALLMTIAAIVLCGIVTSWRLTRSNTSEALKTGGRNASANRFTRQAGNWLISAQCAITYTLMIGSGLLLASLYRAQISDPGFDSKNVTTFRIHLQSDSYPWGGDIRRFRQRLDRALISLPGLESHAIATNVPGYGYFRSLLYFPGTETKKGMVQPMADIARVSPGYFETLDLELLQGRVFMNLDLESKGEALIIDKRFAALYFPDKNPIGQRLNLGTLPSQDEEWSTVIGVVETARNLALDDQENFPFAYRLIPPKSGREFSVFLKSRTDSQKVLNNALQITRELDPGIAPFRSGTLDQLLGEGLQRRKAILWLICIFAGFALLLSATGIYGTLAYHISQRKKEFSIRLAIGATNRNLIESVVKLGLRQTTLGLLVGFLLAIVLARSISSMLYSVKANDPAVYATIAGLVFIVAILASSIPAIHAVKSRSLEGIKSD